MRDESQVWLALLRRKGLSVTELAEQVGVTQQQVHELLTARAPAGADRARLEHALALGTRSPGRPLYAIGELDEDGELDIVPAGDAQPLFAGRDMALGVAQGLEAAFPHVCVLPVWPTYAWRSLVGFHAAWGADPEPRKLFLVDAAGEELPPEAIIDEIRAGLEATLRARAQTHDPALLAEVDSRLSGYTDARVPQ